MKVTRSQLKSMILQEINIINENDLDTLLEGVLPS